MAFSKEDRDEIRQIVREELDPIERKLDAMMELLAPLLYERHHIRDLRSRVDAIELRLDGARPAR